MWVKRAAFISSLINLAVGIEWAAGVFILEQLLDKSSFHGAVIDVVFPIGYAMGGICMAVSLLGLSGASKDQWKPLALLSVVLVAQCILTVILTVLFADDVIIRWSGFCRSSFATVAEETCRKHLIVFAMVSGSVMLVIFSVMLQTVAAHAQALRHNERVNCQDGVDLFDDESGRKRPFVAEP